MKARRSWVFPWVCHDICYHKEAFQKPITPCHDYLPFFLPSLFIIHVRVYSFFLIHHNFPPVHLSESHIFLFFSLSFSLWIKPFSFLSMTTLICYPCHKKTVRPWDLSSIVLPLIMYKSCWLMWDYLRPTFQQVTTPSTSAPYLG